MNEPVFVTSRSAESESTGCLALDTQLSTDTAETLLTTILERRGSPLELDASAVEHIGGLAAEVLVSASKTWADDDQAFAIIKPSDACRDGLERLGLETLLSAEAL